ncbi:hypothetical protein SERLADRAFT_366371 [Serpula lacrymans var. lacrymans S7.9]|uniref:RING-CH-type domain-containing protein n=2 Tax=Serpula lacrymans var. lacrymans TaxID=341189 RepID=F8NJT9_SERL9|nr:uncharacterized protein SERLADRAFT_366371 [Serpula lacrymans var. lacrymans S7.9]EGO28675.1 hypothetical protein SERLADRAFT_366371 [Serpula lacrymans var. lacrymans S7.9]
MPTAQRSVPTVNDLRVKLCYICREEERYDAPEDPPRPWTHPCNCTLVAHESCLLQWIQTSQQNRSRAPNALKCPQCGSAYELESDNPWILRLLDSGNKALSLMGRMVTVASVTSIVVSFGAGIYIVSTAYGAYALQEFLGKEMFDILLSEDPSNWPWHSFINLPLIPVGLIVSRLPFSTTVLPIVPMLLAWTTSTPVQSNERIILEKWKSSIMAARREEYPVLPNWPPPPMLLGLFVFPVVRHLYKRLSTYVSHWVLNTHPNQANAPIQRVVLALNEGGPFRIRIGANLDDHPEGDQGNAANAQAGARQPNAEVGDNADAAPEDAAAAAENTIRVSGTSLGRLIGGALIIPRISSLMGSLLLRLSRHSLLLRRILAVRPPLPRGVVLPPLGPMFNEKKWQTMGLAKQMGLAGVMGLTVAWRGTYAWAECDPVWWRNSIGLGLFTLAKDCLYLLHLWLAKRELESRRVKSRSFEGVDARELDLIVPRTS